MIRVVPPLFLASLVFSASLLSIGQALTASRRYESLSTTKSHSQTSSLSLLRFGKSRNNDNNNKIPYKSLVAGLSARPRRHYDADNNNDNDNGDMARQRLTERPPTTQTYMDEYGPNVSPPQPKIVVLGATGKIGRLVVKQLLEMESIDMTVVALVRDVNKAIWVLSDDLIVARSKKGGPKLQIVEGDLVPPEELPGFVEDAQEEQLWLEKATSASKYLGNDVHEYDNREELPDVNEALEDAIKDCTTVISCVGSVRPTNLWTDVLQRPLWRLLKPDVSQWCKDGRHPYYVHYAATRKALGFAEREQVRREAAARALSEDSDQVLQVPKIRFIRISDLGVGHKPWHFVPLVTNVIQSVVFRYQEMAEQLLDRSALVETVVLRPGDLMDDERDVNTTSIQVCHTGVVPSPARVGREDVASLAVAAAMFPTKNDTSLDNNNGQPFHYTFACRWVGQNMDPFPAQGRKADGLSDADAALRRTLNTIHKTEKRSQLRRDALKQRNNDQSPSGGTVKSDNTIIRMADKRLRQRKRTKPHGVCVAVSIYLFLGLFAKTLIYPSLQFLPGGKLWVLPALARLNELTIRMFSFLLERLMMAMPLITRRKQYILF